MAAIADHDVLGSFSPAVRAWFSSSFPAPTGAQIMGWPPITAGEHTLICAPTGSGKTLAAFLAVLDRYTLADIVRNRAALGPLLGLDAVAA